MQTWYNPCYSEDIQVKPSAETQTLPGVFPFMPPGGALVLKNNS